MIRSAEVLQRKRDDRVVARGGGQTVDFERGTATLGSRASTSELVAGAFPSHSASPPAANETNGSPARPASSATSGQIVPRRRTPRRRPCPAGSESWAWRRRITRGAVTRPRVAPSVSCPRVVDEHRLPRADADGRPVDREPRCASPAVRRLDAARGDGTVEQRDRAERDRSRLARRSARARGVEGQNGTVRRRSEIGRRRPERDYALRRQHEGRRAGPDARGWQRGRRKRCERRRGGRGGGSRGRVLVVVAVPSARADATVTAAPARARGTSQTRRRIMEV